MGQKKGFATIFITVGLIILAAVILLAPFPYYFNGWCDMPCYEENCCPSKGWHLGSSILEQFVPRFSPSSQNGEDFVTTVTTSPETNFSKDGVLVNYVKNEGSGLSIVYEQPGQPALSLGLNFNFNSKCDLGVGKMTKCDLEKLPYGAQVHIEGKKIENKVVVSTLKVILK